ncbi:MAG: 3-isopropylmalate dehydratase [Candidatus Omnitrophota bacterium]
MELNGKAIKLGDDINTDFIISGRYKFSITDIKELSRHIMEDIDPGFHKKIIPGKTILVCGKNFGMGSSREQAPLVIKESGIIAVAAISFARIFYRNSFNIGLPLVEADTTAIREGDDLEINFTGGAIKDRSRGIQLSIGTTPGIMQELLKAGGAVNYYKKYGGFPEFHNYGA